MIVKLFQPCIGSLSQLEHSRKILIIHNESNKFIENSDSFLDPKAIHQKLEGYTFALILINSPWALVQTDT